MIILKFIRTTFILATILVVIFFFLGTLLSNGFNSIEMQFYAGTINFDEFVNRLIRKNLIIFILNLISYATICLLLSKDKKRYILLMILLMLFIIDINSAMYIGKNDLKEETNIFKYLVDFYGIKAYFFYIFPIITFFFMLFCCIIFKRKETKVGE